MTPPPLDLDCGDNSCLFATKRGGMRTNGGCRCLQGLGFSRGLHHAIREMVAELLRLREQVAAMKELER